MRAHTRGAVSGHVPQIMEVMMDVDGDLCLVSNIDLVDARDDHPLCLLFLLWLWRLVCCHTIFLVKSRFFRFLC